MSAYTQFGYTYAPPTSQLVVGQGGGSAGTNNSTSTCCDGARALMTDPVTGQTVCSCQYDRLALGSYSRLGSSLSATTGSVYGSTYPGSDQAPYPSIGMDSSAFYSPLGTGYGMKEGSTSDVGMYGTGLGASPAGYYPYDATFAAYGYAPGYDLAARRKNATRESTATLKAWLNEHKKNPYPTKGEKIMLAIITKMTLTQVSTWFANARRRLKKENKMTWEPRNKTDDDDAKLSDDDEDEKELGDKDDDDLKKDDKDPDTPMTETKVEDSDCQTELKACDGGAVSKTITAALSPAPILHHGSPYPIPKGDKSDCAMSLPSSKPKIWSLADTAASKTPPPVGTGWLNGATTFPLPPTIPPQPQYSRFSQLMSGVNGQYMAGYNDTVGTDTPPQTPPNANKSSSSNGANQSGMISSNFLNGPSSNFAGNLSSCSRGSLPLANNMNGTMDAGMHQRFSSGNPANTSASAMLQNTSFSDLYKSQSQNNNAQPPMTSHPSLQTSQQIHCQSNHQPVSVTGSYVS